MKNRPAFLYLMPGIEDPRLPPAIRTEISPFTPASRDP